jgi:hypothetical protein
MYTKEIAELDQLVNCHTIRGTLGLLAELAAERAKQCRDSVRAWQQDNTVDVLAPDQLGLETITIGRCPALADQDKLDGLQWAALGHDLVVLARKFKELQ